jgi:hypothetical protein
VNFPVADAFQPGEPLFCRFERPFRRARRANDNRALTAPEKPSVSRDLVEEANAIAGHRAVLPCHDDISILRRRSRTHDLNQSHCFAMRYQSAPRVRLFKPLSALS